MNEKAERMDTARFISSQCWTDKETKHLTMDSMLMEAFAKRVAGYLAAEDRRAEELDAYALTVSNLRREQGEPVAWGMPDACGNIVDTVTALDKTGEMKAWEAQYSIPLFSAAPAPEPERKPFDLEDIIDSYVDDYELVDEDVGVHRPGEFERFVIKDVIMGLLADPDWDAAWGRVIAEQAQPERKPAHTEAEVTLILDAFDNIELRKPLANAIRRILGVPAPEDK